MIPLHVPTVTGKEFTYVKKLLDNPSYFQKRFFLEKCEEILESWFPGSKILLTNSCTHALELSALLIDVEPGDEIIMPSFTHVSTANCFVLRGATPVFVDIEPNTMNINENLIQQAITAKTRAIVPVHYSGVGCVMETIMEIAKKYDLMVIEDAAHSVMAKYNEEFLGSFGHISCISFDYIKNITCGEGGAIILNDKQWDEKVEIIYENGTNRAEFFRGNAGTYEWKDVGSKFYTSDLNAAFLYDQLLEAESITAKRREMWSSYRNHLEPLCDKGLIDLPIIPGNCAHNAHVFYIKTKNANQLHEMMQFLKGKGISSAFHYLPLHSSDFGQKAARFCGEDQYTTKESERLLRLPLYHSLNPDDIFYITQCVKEFYS